MTKVMMKVKIAMMVSNRMKMMMLLTMRLKRTMQVLLVESPSQRGYREPPLGDRLTLLRFDHCQQLSSFRSTPLRHLLSAFAQPPFTDTIL